MKFIAYSVLVKVLGFSNENSEELNSAMLRKAIRERPIELLHSNMVVRDLSKNHLIDLVHFYERSENKLFSDWVLSDEVLMGFLDDNLDQQLGEVKKYKNHFLEDTYKSFISVFLFDKLKSAVRSAIRNNLLNRIALCVELSTLLPKEEKFIVQQHVAKYIEAALLYDPQRDHEKAKILMKPEVPAIIGKLVDSFYGLKVSFTKLLQSQLEEGDINPHAVKTMLEPLGLNKAHLVELENYLDKRQEVLEETKRHSLISFVKSPPFIFSVLLVVIVILLSLFSNRKQKIRTHEVQQKRTGLDSLSKDQVVMADTVLGYKEINDSSILENNMGPDM